jgi:hypothetical protein
VHAWGRDGDLHDGMAENVSSCFASGERDIKEDSEKAGTEAGLIIIARAVRPAGARDAATPA